MDAPTSALRAIMDTLAYRVKGYRNAKLLLVLQRLGEPFQRHAQPLVDLRSDGQHGIGFAALGVVECVLVVRRGGRRDSFLLHRLGSNRKPIVESSVRRGVTVVEVVDGVSGSGDVVGPFEVEAQSLVSCRNEGATFDSEMELMLANLERGGGDGLPRFAIPTLHASFVPSTASLIDAEVVTKSARSAVLIGVDQ